MEDCSEDNCFEPNNQSYDEVLLHRLKTSVSGVPPPPVLTYPQQNIDDILNYIKNSENLEIPISDAATSSTYLVFSPEKIEKFWTFWKNYAVWNCVHSSGSYLY